mmetsp:Transcript_26950/g.55003  ORF Transcript_26950/g.55003 Transcript_26950/m.55003 type:complete len:696 (-) Transcript_26950:109-2196(-)
MTRTYIRQRRSHTRSSIPLIILYGAHFFRKLPVNADRDALVALIDRLDSDVLELRNTIESSIANRCESIRGCYRSSYDECRSSFNSGTQTCPSKEQLGYAIPECGQGLNCNGIFDYGATSVRLPGALANGPNGNPTNPFVIEGICYTRTAERWMVDKYYEEQSFWESLGVPSPQMYYGSGSGMFRIHPARHSRECGAYDPRERPWYMAAVPSTISSLTKPRHVVIVMDTSRSMGQLMDNQANSANPVTKLAFMKNVVTSILRGLSNMDSVSVIRFGERVHLVGHPGSVPPYMWQRANPDLIARIVDAVNAVEVTGRSDWIAGFDFAFDLIDNSLRNIAATSRDNCKIENTALLFFTDGIYNLPDGINDQDIIDFVSSRVEQVEGRGEFFVHTFLYSLNNDDVTQVAKQISCAVDGFWKPVVSSMGIANVTNGYQTLFSTPLGTEFFYNYTTWSEPYIFASSGEPGYTVSALVYNREVDPPRFMGAVGTDISAEASRRIYGGTLEETDQAITEITNENIDTKFNTTCEDTRINLTYCEIQSIRHLSGGRSAICLPPVQKQVQAVAQLPGNTTGDTNTTDTEVIDIETTETVTLFDVFLNCSNAFIQNCPGMDEYPTDLWRNVALEDKSYEDRVCCEVGEDSLSSLCPKLDQISDTKLSETAIFSILFISLAITEILGCYYCFRYKKRKRAKEEIID